MKQFIKDFIEGIYSGIPLCCTISYSLGRDGIQATKEYVERTLRPEDYISYCKKYPCNYVQCRSCEKKNRSVEIKSNGSFFK